MASRHRHGPGAGHYRDEEGRAERIFPNVEFCLRLIRALCVECASRWGTATGVGINTLKPQLRPAAVQQPAADEAVMPSAS